jgi:hypothetical protein
MKTVMKYTLLITPLLLTACDSKLRFAGTEMMQKSEIIIPVEDIPSVIVDPPPVVEPPPVNPPGPEPVYSKTSGACAADSSTAVLSCLQCEVPPLPAVEPPMSLKARQLLHIMTQACGIYNKSYDSSYVAPEAAAHLAKLNRCSPDAYKDTAPTKAQANLLDRLTSNDAALYNKMFGGLWYQPPYSDNFETYFGVEVREAVQVFCTQNNPNFTGNLYPIAWYQADDPSRVVIPKAYVNGNIYRSELKACLNESVNNPWKPTGPNPVQKVCNFETLTGESGDKINTQVSEWLAAGYKVGADVKNQGLCLSVTQVDQLSSYQGELSVGGYRCN